MAKIKLSTAGYPIANPRQNKITPIEIAKIVKRMIKRLIYFFKGDSSVLAFAARLAIWPMNVRSPVAKTTPFPVPSLFKVEKNAMFFVYNGLSLVHYTLLARSSVSPVKEELSTFIPTESMILRSAGIFRPSYTFTTSPLTNLVASNFLSSPFLITMVSAGMKSLKLPIIA